MKHDVNDTLVRKICMLCLTAGVLMHAQLMMGMRPNLPNTSNRFSAPSNVQQRPQVPIQQVRQQRPQALNLSSSSSQSSSSFKAQQAKQRQEVLAHAQNFLNPYKKPVNKMGDGESSPASPATPINTPQTKEDPETLKDQGDNTQEKKWTTGGEGPGPWVQGPTYTIVSDTVLQS